MFLLLICTLYIPATSLAPAQAAESTNVEVGSMTGQVDAFYRPYEAATTVVLVPAEPTELEDGPWQGITPLAATDVEDLLLPTNLEEMVEFLIQDWEQYETAISLENALLTAITSNHALNARRLESAAASTGVDIQRTDWWPKVGLQAKGYYQDSNASADPMVIPIPGGEPLVIDTSGGPAEDFHRSLALSLNQRIYDWGLNNDLMDLANVQHAIAKQTIDLNEQQLVSELVTAYYQYNLALAQIRVRTDEVELSKEFLRQAQIQFEVGTVPRLDVIRAEARLELAHSALVAAQAQVGNSVALFYSMLGVRDQRYVPALANASLASMGSEPLELNTTIETALTFRPELEMQYAALAAAKVNRNFADNRPILNAYANALYSEPAGLGGSQAYEYGLELNWQLFTGKENLEANKAELELAAIGEGILELEAMIELDVTTAWNRVVETRAATLSAKQGLELSNEALRVAAIGYNAGVTPYIEYESALDQNIAAALAYLTSLAQVKIAQVSLMRAQGFPAGYPGDSRASTQDEATIFDALGIEPLH